MRPDFCSSRKSRSVFFCNDTTTTAIYTLSLHDALPISRGPGGRGTACWLLPPARFPFRDGPRLGIFTLALRMKRHSSAHAAMLPEYDGFVVLAFCLRALSEPGGRLIFLDGQVHDGAHTALMEITR